jgi:hypothetical protein
MKSKLLAAVILLPSAASAELLSQDTFSGYALGQLHTTTSPTIAGYSGDWTGIDWGNAKPAVTAGTLSYGGANYVPGSGNKVTVISNAPGEITEPTSGRVFRLFDSSLTVTDSTTGTLYLSLLFQSGQETGATTYQTLALFNTDTADANRNFDIGFTGGTIYNFGVNDSVGPNQTVHSTGVNADTGVHLFVVKFTLSNAALSDSVTVWVDPDLSAGEPTGGTTVSGRDLAWDRLALSDYDGNSCAWDEIRWGTTFDSVTTESFLPVVPTFTLQPTGFTGYVGDAFALSAAADSDPTPTLQWEYSPTGNEGAWTEIFQANAATLEYPFSVYSDNGFYRLVATNANGSVTSNVVEVSLVYPDPEITTQPVSTAAQMGDNASFTVNASGIGELSYQWYKGVQPIDGAISDTLSLIDVQLVDAGDYKVVVTDHAAEVDGQPATTIFSNIVTLTVYETWSGLVSHEPFDSAAGYTEGELPGQDPAVSGYSGAWTDIDGGDTEPAIAAGSLIYANPLYLGSSGDKVAVPTNTAGGEIVPTNSGRVYRLFDTPFVVGANTTGTRYLSFLFQSGQETAVTTYQMLSLVSANTGDGIRPFEIGITNDHGQPGSDSYNFGVSGALTSTGVAENTGVHLFVVKFDLSAAADSDNVTVWVDPTLGSGEPAGGISVTGANLDWNRIILSDYDGNSAAWDEIRWGSTFDSVTLNPNPADDYAAWIAGYPGVGSLTGFNDDADGDGIDNGMENLFGTDPSVFNQGIVQVAKSGNTVTFQHSQSATPASDVSASYVWSTDLVTFHPDGASAGGVTVGFDTSTDAGTTTVTATITGTVPAKLFVSLKATQATP